MWHVCLLSAQAGNVTWNKGATGGDNTYNLNDAANWNGGVPANGSNLFLVISATTGGNNSLQTITNAAGNSFSADSLSLSNTSTKVNAAIFFKGPAAFTNGVGLLDFAGTSGGQFMALTFSNTLAFKTLRFNGSGGSAAATLTLAGATTGQDLIFNGGSGNNFLNLSGPLNLSGTLWITNINATSAGTLSGDATVSRLVFNNPTKSALTIKSSTLAITGAQASVAGGFTLAADGTLEVTGSGGLIFSNVMPQLNGTLLVSNSTLNSVASWVNNGTVRLDGGWILGSALTNAANSLVTGFGTLSNVLINAGNLVATNGELRLINPVSGAGAYRAAAGGTLTFAAGGTISALFNTGATVRVEGGVLSNTAAFVNRGTIAFAGGNYSSVADLVNPAGFTLRGFGTLAAGLNNSGTATVLGSGMTFAKPVTNAGLVEVIGSTAVFNSQFVLASGGVLSADAGSVLKFRGDFINNSTQSNAFNLLAASVFFDGGAGNNTQRFTVAGLDLGADLAGYSNNFAVGSFTVGGSSGILQLIGAGGHALYVSNLTVTAGSTLLLNGFTLYMLDDPLIEGTVVNGGGQLVVIPEPSATALVGAGLLLLILSRRPATASRPAPKG